MEEAAKLRGRIFEALERVVKKGIDVWCTPRETVLDEGTFKLLHYYPTVENTLPTPVLIVYAYINRPYVMDLYPGVSVVEKLLETGLNVYMIDWGYPSRADRYLSIVDYIDFIDVCISKIKKELKVEQVTLHGYCLGGTLSTIYTALDAKKVRNLILQAAPIDFDTHNTMNIWAKSIDPDKIIDAFGCMPGAFLNTSFLTLDPVRLIIGKYESLFEHIEDDYFVRDFLRMERWVFDSPAIPGNVYREYIKEWYQENKIIKGEYVLNGERVDLRTINVPTLILAAEKDHIAPPASLEKFFNLILSQDKQILSIDRGHIGISTSKKAYKELWPKACEWIKERSG